MRLEMKIIGCVLTVNVFGELDLNTAPDFRNAIEHQLNINPGINNILLLMSGVTFIDSSGLGVIVGRYKKLKPRGGDVIVVAPSPQARKSLELSGLAGIMHICNTEDEAWSKTQGV